MSKNQKYFINWIGGVVIILLVNLIGSFFYAGIDLTADKRYTITDASLKYVKELQHPLELTVYIKGEVPAGFKKLANAAENISNNYNRISNGNFSIRFEKPGEGLSDSAKAYLFDSLQQLGVHPTNVKSQATDRSQTEETLVFPGAVLTGENGQIGIDFLEGQSSLDGLDALNNATSQLEYKITRAIKILERSKIPVVGYLAGNGEVLDLQVYDLIENVLKKEYGFGLIQMDSFPFIPHQFDILLINKPMRPFTEKQKLMIDQYIMHGGKVIWALDNLYASMDSLQKSNGSFLAYDMGLNLDDQLFKYGVRINRDLVQDLESDQVPSIVGNIGNKPQIQLLPWPYAPLVSDFVSHPISRNLDKVLTSFPQSIDTISTTGISKNILLSSSIYGKKIPTPALVEWKPVKTESDLQSFQVQHIPVAVLLEGPFPSLYKNRISIEEQLSFERTTGGKYLSNSTSNQMIVISDGDIFLNPVSEEDGPLTMGSNKYTRIQYGNKEFFKNILFYLSDGKDLLSSRSKNFQLRLLNKELLKEQTVFWKIFNLLTPVLILLICMLIFRQTRMRKYSRISI